VKFTFLIVITLFFGSLNAFEKEMPLYQKGRVKLLDFVAKAYSQQSNAKLIEFLNTEIKPSRHISAQKKNLELASAIKFLKILDHDRPKEGLGKWILADDERFYEFTYLFTEFDDKKKSLAIIKELFEHDPKERDKFSDLIFAFSVVWDQERPLIHNFMGKNAPKYTPSLKERYDLLKSVYNLRSCPMNLKYLNSRMLVYVVDLPIPVSEMKWALANEKGRASTWGKKFDGVRYDVPRFNRNQFVWNHGAYNLANVKKHGGICIDRAYYTAMTARSWGIPSMIFTGKGRTGGHAWLGLMKSAKKWTMDIHRYSQGNYSAGKARNPQTNQLINDHELELLVSPEYFSSDYDKAVKINELAKIYSERKDGKQAVDLLVNAIRSQSLFEEPWNRLYEIYIQENKLKEAYDLLRRMTSAFRKHEDRLIEIYNKQISVLEKMGRPKDAEYIRKSILIKMRNRDDLLAEATISQAEEYISAGKKDEARKVYEKYIRANAKEGFKIIEMVETYLEMMVRTNQVDLSVKFLKLMVSRVPASSRGWMEGFLLEAYIKNGDEREAKKLKERMRKSKMDIDL